MNINIIKHIASLFILTLFLLLAVGSIDSDADVSEVQSGEPMHQLSAEQLFREYENNEVAADEKFKGKIVLVSGLIEDIGKDLLGIPYIVLYASDMFGVQCLFPKDDASSVAALSKDQSVTVKGIVVVKMGNVILENCAIVDESSTSN